MLAENFHELVDFADETFADFSLVPPKDAIPPSFMEKTFVNSHKTVGFSPWKVFHYTIFYTLLRMWMMSLGTEGWDGQRPTDGTPWDVPSLSIRPLSRMWMMSGFTFVYRTSTFTQTVWQRWQICRLIFAPSILMLLRS